MQVHLAYVPEPLIPAGGHVAVVADDYAAAVAALRGAGHPVDPRDRALGCGACLRAHAGGPHRRGDGGAAARRPDRGARRVGSRAMRERIQAANDATYAAWCAHDADAVAAVFAEDAVAYDVGNPSRWSAARRSATVPPRSWRRSPTSASSGSCC